MRSIGIVAKVWLSLSVLVFVYALTTAAGIVVGIHIENRLSDVSKYFIPAANKSQLALAAFEEQIRAYSDVVVIGKVDAIPSAKTKGAEAKQALEDIVSLEGLSEAKKREVRELLKSLEVFNAEADSLYSPENVIPPPNWEPKNEKDPKEEANNDIIEKRMNTLAGRTVFVRTELTRLKTHFSKRLKDELAAISNITNLQGYMEVVVFFASVILSLGLVQFIIRRTISRPLDRILMLEKAVEQSVDGIAVTNLKGELQFINKAWAKMHGYTIAELKEKHIEMFYSSDFLEMALAVDPISTDGYSMESGEVWHVRKNKTIFPTMQTISILKDNNNSPVNVVYIARDITRQKKTEQALQNSEEKFKILTEVQSDVVLRMRTNWQLEYISPAIKEFGGYDPEIALKKSFEDYFVNRNELIAAKERFEEIIRSKSLATFEFLFKPKNRAPFYVEISGKPVVVENKVSILQFVMRDVSERKKIEKDLQESLENLKSAQTQLVQSEKMAALGGLVAGVAHEINTPLGVGITAASFLNDKTTKCANLYVSGNLKRSDLEKYIENATESSTMILTNLNRAAELVRSFKQVAADQTNEERRSFNLRKTIEEILFALRPKFKRTNHTITVHCPDELILDNYPGVFSQIVTNLVMNSLIHGFENMESGEIEFNIWVEDDTLVFSYNDNGKGMDAKTLEKSFDPFFTTNRSHGGTGLGMHILYNLVTQTLRGQIEYTSAPGKGVLFLFRIPIGND